jgi:hypothetical protein
VLSRRMVVVVLMKCSTGSIEIVVVILMRIRRRMYCSIGGVIR